MSLEERIIQFVSITGSTEDTARKYLDVCAGNLDMAIGMHLENGDSVKNSTKSTVSPPASQTSSDVLSNSQLYEEVHGVRAPIPQTSGVLIEDETPPRKILRSRRLPQTVFDPFQDYSDVVRNSQDGNDTRRNLAELFRPPHDLLFNGTFHEAKLAGQQKMQWLIVNLQDSKEFSSQMLNRDVWSNHNVKELIKRNFVFMQIHRINDEGVRFKQLYHVDSYPCIAVIDPRTGEKMMSWGNVTADKFIHELSEFLSNNAYQDEGINVENKNIVNQSEALQMEAAIKASLLEIKPSILNNTHSDSFSDYSDKEYISLSSDEESSPSCEALSNASVVKSIGQSSSLLANEVDSGGRTDIYEKESLANRTSSDHHILYSQNRKRPSNIRHGGYVDAPRKKIRTELDPVCTAINNIELVRSKSDSVERDSAFMKVRVNGKTSKGKGKATDPPKKSLDGKAQHSDEMMEHGSIEDRVSSGVINMDDVSQILFRLPDGSRLQKSFLCKSTIRELLRYLESQSIKLSEHEVVTHFPKRSILEMDFSSSLKQNGLYPRETVFIHTL